MTTTTTTKGQLGVELSVAVASRLLGQSQGNQSSERIFQKQNIFACVIAYVARNLYLLLNLARLWDINMKKQRGNDISKTWARSALSTINITVITT